jgi:hypothetical protein
MSKSRPELQHFSNVTWESAAKPNGSFWTGYAAWLTTQGQQLLHPRELVAVRCVLYLKRAEEELKILEAEIYRVTKWMHRRIEAIRASINIAKEALSEKVNSLETLGLMDRAVTERGIDMIRGQLAVYYRILSDATSQLHDFESRFPQGRASTVPLPEIQIENDQAEYLSEEDADVLQEDEYFGHELEEMDEDEV